MIEQLAAFEDYSARCEVTTKQDAALHGYLHQITARARWLMEVALERLADKRIGQALDEVGQIVDVQAPERRGQLPGFHVADPDVEIPVRPAS